MKGFALTLDDALRNATAEALRAKSIRSVLTSDGRAYVYAVEHPTFHTIWVVGSYGSTNVAERRDGMPICMDCRERADVAGPCNWRAVRDQQGRWIGPKDMAPGANGGS